MTLSMKITPERTLVDSLSVELAGEKIDLPSFPDVAMRVRKALTSEEVGIEDAVKIVSAEPALAARLMQLSNSATLNPGWQAPQQPPRRNGAHRPQYGLQRDHCLRDVAAAPCRVVQGHRDPSRKTLARSRTPGGREPRDRAAFHHAERRHGAVGRLLQCVGKLYLLTRAARFPALLADDAALDRITSEYHLRVAQAILRNWDMDAEIVKAIGTCDDLTREHAGAIDLTDVLVASAALIALGPDATPDEVAFPGMPAARRLGLDGAACSVALAESRDEIQALRQALNV
jgi:HD-like signal output (HDOD) protein